MPLHLQPMQVATGSRDREGLLVLSDNRLMAVLVRLSDPQHGGLTGTWFLEAGFGPCASVRMHVFETVEQAQDWVEQRMRAS